MMASDLSSTPERNIIFDMNDFGETLPGPWEWDIKRLAASMVIAARHLDLVESDAAMPVWYDRIDLDRVPDALPDEEARAKVRRRTDRAREKSAPEHLAPKLIAQEGKGMRIRDEPPLIMHPSAQLAPGMQSNYRTALEAHRASLPDHRRHPRGPHRRGAGRLRQRPRRPPQAAG
jgi:hypothetical protein